MKPEEITALAREYGEYVANSLDFDMYSAPNLRYKLVAKGNSESAQSVLEWLLSRYCLVEKDKVENIHKGILVQLDPKNFGYSPYNQGRLDVIKSLFPEIAKEVEG